MKRPRLETKIEIVEETGTGTGAVARLYSFEELPSTTLTGPWIGPYLGPGPP